MSGVVKTIKKVVKGIVKAVVGVVKAVVNVISSVVSFITQPFMGLFGGMPDGLDAAGEADRQQGVLVTRNGSTVSIPVVYGLRRVGGTITFAETGANNNQYLWVAYGLSEGPIEGLFDLFIDDNQLASKYIPLLNNGQTVTVDEGKYKGRIVMRLSHGKHYATPSSSTIGGTWNPCSDAPSWKSSNVYNGLATLFVRYEWKHIETQEDSDNNPFSGNIPAIKTTLLGRKVATITSSSGSTAYASESENYSTNPAEILLDYLRNPRYGKGLKNTDIDWNSFLIAKNKYNQVVTYVASGITGPVITCNTVVDTGQTLFGNVKMLLMGCRSYLPFSQGKYKLKVEDAGNATDITSGVATIVQTFNSDNIQGAVTYQAIERSAKYNVVEINYVNPDKAYSVEAVIYPELLSERQTYIDKDGGRENKLTATFPTLTNYAVAKDMARLLFNKSRFQESVSFTASSQALELEVGDNIRIQSTMLNFGTTPFRVITMKINNDMTVDLGCVRNDDSLYPHTRVGEEDVVLPPYVPKGGKIFYPEIINVPIGLLPPLVGPVPIVHYPPQIFSTAPVTVASAGVHNITASGQRFYSGLTAVFVGEDGTEYTPTTTTRSSDNQVIVATTAAMTNGNQPYDIKITNPSGNGSLSTRANDCLTVNNTVTTPPPPVTDPPVVTPPDDPVTPPPTLPPVTPPPTETPVPEPPAIVYNTDETVEFTRADYTTEGSLVYATITATQPTNPAYKELILYYKRNIRTETVYQQMVVTTKPGANNSFTFRVGPLLPLSPYYVIGRVKYSDGELSSKVNKVYLNTSGTSEDPRDYVVSAKTGWPSDPGVVAPIKDSPFGSINGDTLLTGGEPKVNKEIQFSVKQDVNIAPANFDIIGVAYYVKASSATTWTRHTATFDQSYGPGAEASFVNDSGILGTRSFPSTPTNAQQNYDFIFRFMFTDGTESLVQSRYMNIPTEIFIGNYVFNPFYGTPAASKEKVTDYEIKLTDPNAPSAASLMELNLTDINSSSASYNHLRLYFNPPHASVQASWVGTRLRYRKVVPGTDPDFIVQESTSTYISPTGGQANVFVPVDFDDDYEFVLTPLYNNSGVRTDSKNSTYFRGYAHRNQSRSDYPLNNNWLQSYNPRTMTTAKALGIIDASFPAPAVPIVEVAEFKLLQGPALPWRGNTAYYKLTFNHHAVTDFSKLHIYRRENNPQSTTESIKKGRWEKVEISTVSSTPGSTTVYLRPPLSASEFNGYFTPTNGQSLFVKYPIKTSNSTYYYVDATHGFTSSQTQGLGHEFLLVVKDASAEKTQGVFLKGAALPPLSAEVDLLLGFRPVTRNVADFNGFNSAYQKNISQAITPITNANCLTGLRAYVWGDYAPSVSPGMV